MSSAQFAAFTDELTKIAEETRGKRLKTWLKNTALIGAGTAAGVGGGMLAEEAAKKLLGSTWARWSAPTKTNILRGASGLVGAATFLAADRYFRERERARNEEKADQR